MKLLKPLLKLGNPIEYLDILYYLGYLPVEGRGAGAGGVGGGEAGAGVGGVGGDGGGEGLEHAQYEAHLPDHHVQYSTVQYSTVQYSIQYSIQYSVQYLITTSGWVWVVKVLKLAIRLFTSSATLSSSPEAVSMAAIPSSRLATQMVSAFS